MESHKLFLTRKCACTGEQVDTCLSKETKVTPRRLIYVFYKEFIDCASI